MAEKDDDATEAWGRRPHERLEDLPRADPIAYLGTERHPVSIPPTTERHPASIPPTTHDLEESASMEKGADSAKKSHVSRRLVAVGIGLAIILPMAVSLSSSDDVARAPATRASLPPPRSPAEHARQNAQLVPTDLPPGGVTDGPLPEGEPPLSPQQSIADWKPAPALPTASYRGDTTTGNESTSESRSSSEGEQAQPASAAAQSPEPAEVKPPGSLARSRPGRNAVTAAKPFDFSAAMSTVAGTGVGRVQCGPDAVGATQVAITFAPSGQATHAVVEDGPLRGTEAGSCVARELRKVQIAPFDGRTATLRTSVLLR
jgi:hypothetical protein